VVRAAVLPKRWQRCKKSSFDVSVIDMILSGTIGNSLAVAVANVFLRASRGHVYLGYADTGCFPKAPVVEK